MLMLPSAFWKFSMTATKRASDGEARAVEGVHQFGLVALVAVARLHASGLERLEVGARGDLAVGLLRRQPDLEIVGFRRRESPCRRYTA
jgi:hypothetical protein